MVAISYLTEERIAMADATRAALYLATAFLYHQPDVSVNPTISTPSGRIPVHGKREDPPTPRSCAPVGQTRSPWLAELGELAGLSGRSSRPRHLHILPLAEMEKARSTRTGKTNVARVPWLTPRELNGLALTPLKLPLDFTCLDGHTRPRPGDACGLLLKLPLLI